MGFCSKGLKNEFEAAVVNEPSVFEPLKFYCICSRFHRNIQNCSLPIQSKASFSSSHLRFVTGVVRELFISCGGSLMG